MKITEGWMKRAKAFSLILIVILLASCNHHSPTTEQFVEGGRKYVRVKKYHDNGMLKVNATLREVKDTFLVDGLVEELDQNGNTLSMRSFVNGMMTGSTYYYASSGAIKAYEFYDPEEFLFYKADLNGKDIKEEGNMFPIVVAHPYEPKDSVRVYAINTPYRVRNLTVTRQRDSQKDTVLYLKDWKADFVDFNQSILHDTIVVRVDYVLRDGTVLSDSLSIP